MSKYEDKCDCEKKEQFHDHEFLGSTRLAELGRMMLIIIDLLEYQALQYPLKVDMFIKLNQEQTFLITFMNLKQLQVYQYLLAMANMSIL